jgi:regulator of sigma E protease
MLTVLIFFIVLSVLVLVHEFGHFVTAKRAGVRVDEFGLGFPPRLLKWRRGETLYTLNLIPFGGYVKIFGEDESERAEPRSFGALPVGRRAVIMVAGVTMNLILTVVLLSIVAGVGRPVIVTEENRATARDVQVMIMYVQPGSPAQSAGIARGDELVRIQSEGSTLEVSDVGAFTEFTKEHQGNEATIVVRRGNEEMQLMTMLREDPKENEGVLGVSSAQVGRVSAPWWRAPYDGVIATGEMARDLVAAVGYLFKKIFAGEAVGDVLSGPVGIAVLTGEAARMGFAYLLQLTALLSLNLAILNILPFPALDGGRLVFLAVEKIKGTPINHKIERAVNTVGFALLILLMLWVTFKDVVQFWG